MAVGARMTSVGPNDALYQVVLVAHILCAVVGFGSIAVTGEYASAARRTSSAGQVSDAVHRYFRPGPNLASRFIYAVPVLGLVMAGFGGAGDLQQSWLWLGTGLWLLAAGLAIGVVWPAEAHISSLVSDESFVPAGPGWGAAGTEFGEPGEVVGGGEAVVRAAIARASRRASGAAAVMDLAVVAAFVVMIARPGA